MGEVHMLKVGIVLGTTALLALVGCGNSTGDTTATTEADGGDTSTESGEFVAVDAPGVTDTEIRVEGVTASTNPLGIPADTAGDGVNAYFEMVNSEGGVHGRDLVLSEVHDDQLANNSAVIKGIVDADSAFAVLPIATMLFTGADQLVDANVPSFGWTINPEWEGTEENPKLNLFGQAGSFLCLGCAVPAPAFTADLGSRSKIGLLSYSVPQSTQCLESWQKSIDRWGEDSGIEVVFEDASLTYGTTDLSVQVKKMADAGVDMAMTCMDNNASVTLAKEMKKQDLDAIQFLPNAYDHELMDEFGDLFEDSYVMISFAPLETPEDSKPKGLENFEEWMDKTGGEITENSMVGWLNADLFVTGLRDAGPDFSRQSVIDAINSYEDYNAEGMLPGVNWKERAHTERSQPDCNSYMIIKDGEFELVSSEGTFTCFDVEADTLEPSYQ